MIGVFLFKILHHSDECIPDKLDFIKKITARFSTFELVADLGEAANEVSHGGAKILLSLTENTLGDLSANFQL